MTYIYTYNVTQRDGFRKVMIYKLRGEKIRKTSQQMAETSILTNIRNHQYLDFNNIVTHQDIHKYLT